MKKLSIALLLAALTPLAHADRVLGIYGGAGAWLTEYDGNVGAPAVYLSELGVKEHANNYFYVAIEHPIPIIPNVKLTQTSIQSAQTGTISNTFTIGGTTYNAAEKITSDFDLSHRDITLYYQLLDNWTNFDLGATVRQFDGSAHTKSDLSSKDLKIDLVIPLVYGKFQFDLPFTGLSFGGEANYSSVQDSNVRDYNAKFTYLWDSAVDVGVEVGVRRMGVKLADNDLNAYITLKGPYAAVIAHF